MAQLKDTVVAGSLRATDTIYTTTLQTTIIKAPSTSSGSDYSAGTAGYVLKSGGANGKVYWATDTFTGTLSVSQGGTGATSFTANSIIMSGSTTTAALTTRAITNNTSNTAIAANTNIPTMNTIYYGLVTVNGASQTRATGIYAPTAVGSNGQFLQSSGSGSPSWVTLTKGHVGLANVTNHAQVTSLAYDSTNNKITYKISEGTATDLVTFGANAFTSYPNKITIGSKEITLGGSATLAEIGVSYPVTSVAGLTGAVTKAGLRSALDLSQALRFLGKTTTTMTDPFTGTPAITGLTYTPAIGDVVLDSSSNSEYLCVSVSGTTYTWERLGPDSDWALDANVIHKSDYGTIGDILYASAANTPSSLTGNTTTTRKFLRSVAATAGTATAPAWDTVTKTDVGLSNVENTKLSTWAGTSNITTVGTITTGTWHGTAIEASYIGAHTHGNLTNDGKITSTTTIANGDKLVIVDSDTTAASKITGSSITFDGSSIDKALTPKGTWEIFSKTDTKVEIIHL